MGKKGKQRTRAQSRKAAKRKARAKAVRKQAVASTSVRNPWRKRLQTAARWPLHEVLVSRGWLDSPMPANLIVARRSFRGEIAAAHFEVDLACLGIRAAEVAIHDSAEQYEGKLRFRFLGTDPLVPIELDLAAKLLLSAELHARDLGFEPVADYHDAKLLLGNASPESCADKVPHGGMDGRPMYIARPTDDARAVVDTLVRKVGRRGFTLVAAHDPELEREFALPARDEPAAGVSPLDPRAPAPPAAPLVPPSGRGEPV